MISSELITATLLSGLVLSSLYALLSIGLTLCWGTTKLFNFAHGSLMTFGAYFAWQFLNQFHLSYAVIIPSLFLFSYLLGIIINRVLVQPAFGKPKFLTYSVIATLCLSLVIENGILTEWGPRVKTIPTIFPGSVTFGLFSTTYDKVFIMALAPSILILLSLFLKRTRIGMAIRAVSQASESARLVGINIARTNDYTLGISSVLACITGVFIGSIYTIVPDMGLTPLLIAFVIVIFGGLGSIKGTIIAAYVVGFITIFSNLFIGLYFTPLLLFAFLFAMIIVWPSGMFGEPA